MPVQLLVNEIPTSLHTSLRWSRLYPHLMPTPPQASYVNAHLAKSKSKPATFIAPTNSAWAALTSNMTPGCPAPLWASFMSTDKIAADTKLQKALMNVSPCHLPLQQPGCYRDWSQHQDRQSKLLRLAPISGHAAFLSHVTHACALPPSTHKHPPHSSFVQYHFVAGLPQTFEELRPYSVRHRCSVRAMSKRGRAHQFCVPQLCMQPRRQTAWHRSNTYSPMYPPLWRAVVVGPEGALQGGRHEGPCPVLRGGVCRGRQDTLLLRAAQLVIVT